jgi:hypothetical protein
LKTFTGDPESAITLTKEAIRMTPLFPDNYLNLLGLSNFLLGNHEEAKRLGAFILTRTPEHLGANILLIMVSEAQGNQEETALLAGKIKQNHPTFRISGFMTRQRFKDPATLEKLIEPLRGAGLPD